MLAIQPRSRPRRLLAALLILLVMLVLLWLALPRLLGPAAERWLSIPGLEALHVDVDQVGAGHTRLREVRAVYHGAGGDRVEIAMHDIVLDYSLPEGHLQGLNIARGDVEVFPAQAAPGAPASVWPPLEWPDLPLREGQIGALRVVVHGAQRPPLETQGNFHLRQAAGELRVEFRPGRDLLRLTANQAQAPDDALAIRLEWLPAVGPVADARLTVGRQPAQQPVSLIAEAPLPLLATLARKLGLTLPLSAPAGTLRLQAQALLGRTAGSLQALGGEAQLADALLHAEGTPMPLALALSGKLRFAWQASGAQLGLQPGLDWRLSVGGEQAFQASGRLDEAFALRQEDGVTHSAGKLPFALHSPQWGTWEGALRRITLQGGTALADWRSADAELRLRGNLKQWQQQAIRIRGLQADGDLALHWSRSNELRAVLAMQLAIDRLSSSGGSPLTVGKSTWQVEAAASAKPDDEFPQSLSLQGEASSPQLELTLAGGTTRTLTLGPSRLQLLRFKPAGHGSGSGEVGAPGAAGAVAELRLSADAIRIGNWPSPDLRAHLRLDGSALHADGRLRLQGKEVLRFAGSHALARSCGKATLSARQTLPTLGKRLQPRPPALLPLDLQAGEADARFTLDWCTGPKPRFDVRGRLHVQDANLGWEKARVKGVQTTLRLDGLHPLRGRIRLAAQDGKLATGTRLSDLNVDLALAARTLSVNALQLKLLGGSVGSVAGAPPSLSWPPSEKTLPLQLAVRQIDLGQLLAVLEVQGLSGSGRLGGVLPLAWRDGGLEIDNGQLHSLGSGTLRYAPGLPAPDNPGLQALRNFHFQALGLRLWYAADGAYRTQAKLEGNNPDLYDGYPIRFRLNINGQLPGLFRAALFSGDFNRHILEQLQSGKLE